MSFYASFVNINAYHQPGVEAGKKAAGDFLGTLQEVQQHLSASPGKSFTADEVAQATGGAAEEIFHILTHLSSNSPQITATRGSSPSEDQFTHA